MASYTQIVKELRTLGTAQNRRTYRNHGVTGPCFGVSWANLGKLNKRIKTDHELAKMLWEGGNHDARMLAGMVADAEALDNKTAEAWSKDLDNYVVTGALSGLVGRSSLAQKKVEKWVKSKNEWISTAGWSIAGRLALDSQDLPNKYFEDLLKKIEASIHNSENRTRYAMNNALIAIGVRNDKLEKKAVSAARRIGVVNVDHGKTSCKTPDAVSYIKKTVAHKNR